MSAQIAGPAGEPATPATAPSPSLTPAQESAAARAAAREAAQLLSSLRRHHRGGRKKILRPCSFCQLEMGAAELRRHQPHCSARIRPFSSETPWNF